MSNIRRLWLEHQQNNRTASGTRRRQFACIEVVLLATQKIHDAHSTYGDLGKQSTVLRKKDWNHLKILDSTEYMMYGGLTSATIFFHSIPGKTKKVLLASYKIIASRGTLLISMLVITTSNTTFLSSFGLHPLFLSLSLSSGSFCSFCSCWLPSPPFFLLILNF